MSFFINKANTFYFRTPSISAYLDDIRQIPIISPEKEVELFDRIYNGDNNARNIIIESNQRFVFAIAKRYSKNTENLSDLINEGNIGLITAIDNFKTSVGVKFISFAVWYIRRQIVQYLTNNDAIIRKTNHNKTFKKVAFIKNQFFMKEGRMPNNDEIMELINKKERIINSQDILDLKIYNVSDNIDDDNSSDFPIMNEYNSISASYNDYENKSEKDDIKSTINQKISRLTKREKKIIKLLYGIGEEREYSFQEVGEMFDLTSERIRQLKNTIVKKMQKK